MLTVCLLLPAVKTVLFVLIWLTPWFYLVVFVLLMVGAYIFHSIKINAVLHEKADLERQLLERTELLSYSKLSVQKAREDATLANQNKTTLISKISHDVRIPLNTVLGMASLLTETNLSHEQQEYTNTILYSGENLLTIINGILMADILEYSKIETGKELENKEFDLRNNIEEVFEIFSLKAAQAGIELIYFIKPNVPVQVIGDALRLRQVLVNLVENALRFTKQGEIFIVVNLVGEVEDNTAKLSFEVRDTGAGMTPERLKAISNDLQSENNTTDIGLALIICKKLVRLMGGKISVESQEKNGTIFKFTIEVTAAKQNPRVKTQMEMSKLAGKRILIAEDNLTFGNLIKQQLERWQLDCVFANCGKQALEILTQADFDLALIDFDMPEMNGIELAKAVKQSRSDLPIILMNKNGHENYKEFPSLFSSVMDKPLKHAVFTEQILNLLWKGKDASANDQKQKQKLTVEFAKQYPLNILIAEDDKMNQKLVTKVLNKLGYEPQVAENGKDVLEVVSQKHFDLILMDVQMPEMDGLEATRMIRVCLTEQPIIIAMTANTLQGDREDCLKAGMDDYIGKPVRLDGLVNIIEKWALQGQVRQ